MLMFKFLASKNRTTDHKLIPAFQVDLAGLPTCNLLTLRPTLKLLKTRLLKNTDKSVPLSLSHAWKGAVRLPSNQNTAPLCGTRGSRVSRSSSRALRAPAPDRDRGRAWPGLTGPRSRPAQLPAPLPALPCPLAAAAARPCPGGPGPGDLGVLPPGVRPVRKAATRSFP